MSTALNKAILDRTRGDEVLVAARALQAQTDLAALLGTVNSKPAVALGGVPSSVTYNCIRFREDMGGSGLAGEGIGITGDVLYRFELYSQSRDGTTLRTMADCLELLFDERRDAPALALEGDGRTYASDLFTAYQGPFHDDIRDCFISLIAFRFVEARP